MPKKEQSQGARIYERYNAGDHLTDLEISVGMEMFAKAADACIALGPAFTLAHREANRVYLGLQDIYLARKR